MLIPTGSTLNGKAGTATAVTYTIFGDRKSTTNNYEIVGQGQLASSTGALLTTSPVAASTSLLISSMTFQETTGNPVTGIVLYVGGTGAGNQVVRFSLVANGSATYANGEWTAYDSGGGILGGSGFVTSVTAADSSIVIGGTAAAPTVQRGALSGGDVIASAGSGNLTIDTNKVTYAKSAQAAANTLVGNATAALANKTDIALAASQFLARSSTGNITAKTLTDFALSFMDDATAIAVRQTLDIQGGVGWIDVTQPGLYVALPMGAGESAANNTSRLQAIVDAAPSGSVIYFPGAFFNMSGKVTVGAKALRFQGAFSGVSGGLSALVYTSNVGDNLIQLTDANWYSSFNDLTFINNGTTQSAGSVLSMGSNAYTNVYRCNFGAISGQLNNCIDYTGANSGVISNIYYCVFTGFNGTGIVQGGNLGTIVVDACTMNGAQDTSTIGINIKIGGAMIINNCDIIGCNNNLLINPIVSTVVASVYVVNTYFDSSQGSCIKITGAGATVRCKFSNCQFTTWTTASPNNAVEVSSTFDYGLTGQGLDFLNCNVLNTFSATLPSPQLPSGTGFNLTGVADFSIINCNTALWTTGISITPSGTAGSCQPMITNNSIGPCGGYGANTTGILLNNGAVAYGPIKITQNVIQGNTNDITNSITTNAPVLPNEMDIRDNLGTGKNLYEVRNTATQSVAVSTLVDVTGLSFPLVKPNTRYLFDGVINVTRGTTTNAAGVGVGINAPAGATLDAFLSGWVNTTLLKNVIFTQINTSQTGHLTVPNTASSQAVQFRVAGVVQAGTATSHTGIVQLRLSNNSHTATVYQGSWLRAAKVD